MALIALFLSALSLLRAAFAACAIDISFGNLPSDSDPTKYPTLRNIPYPVNPDDAANLTYISSVVLNDYFYRDESQGGIILRPDYPSSTVTREQTSAYFTQGNLPLNGIPIDPAARKGLNKSLFFNMTLGKDSYPNLGTETLFLEPEAVNPRTDTFNHIGAKGTGMLAVRYRSTDTGLFSNWFRIDNEQIVTQSATVGTISLNEGMNFSYGDGNGIIRGDEIVLGGHLESPSPKAQPVNAFSSVNVMFNQDPLRALTFSTGSSDDTLITAPELSLGSQGKEISTEGSTIQVETLQNEVRLNGASETLVPSSGPLYLGRINLFGGNADVLSNADFGAYKINGDGVTGSGTKDIIIESAENRFPVSFGDSLVTNSSTTLISQVIAPVLENNTATLLTQDSTLSFSNSRLKVQEIEDRDAFNIKDDGTIEAAPKLSISGTGQEVNLKQNDLKIGHDIVGYISVDPIYISRRGISALNMGSAYTLSAAAKTTSGTGQIQLLLPAWATKTPSLTKIATASNSVHEISAGGIKDAGSSLPNKDLVFNTDVKYSVPQGGNINAEWLALKTTIATSTTSASVSALSFSDNLLENQGYITTTAGNINAQDSRFTNATSLKSEEQDALTFKDFHTFFSKPSDIPLNCIAEGHTEKTCLAPPTIPPVSGDIDLKGHKIINLKDAVDPGDVLNYRSMKKVAGSGGAYGSATLVVRAGSCSLETELIKKNVLFIASSCGIYADSDMNDSNNGLLIAKVNPINPVAGSLMTYQGVNAVLHGNAWVLRKPSAPADCFMTGESVPYIGAFIAGGTNTVADCMWRMVPILSTDGQGSINGGSIMVPSARLSKASGEAITLQPIQTFSMLRLPSLGARSYFAMDSHYNLTFQETFSRPGWATVDVQTETLQNAQAYGTLTYVCLRMCLK